MRTKTLLTVAAALAVSAITSMAQTTYSQNVVGYINVIVPANGYYMVANQLVNGSDVAKTNNDINAVLGAGLVSQPIDPPDTHSNTVLYYYNGGYATYYYFNATDANTWNGTPTAGFYDPLGTLFSAAMSQGKAVFLYNNFSAPITATITGNVLQGTNASSVITAGYNMISLQVPVSTNASVAAYGLPQNLTSDPVDPPDPSKNDTMYLYNGGYATYYYFNATDANTWNGTPTAGFYDPLGSPAPAPSVNQGFFLYHTGSTITWTNAFTVQ